MNVMIKVFVSLEHVNVMKDLPIQIVRNKYVLMTALEMVFAEKNKFVNVMMDGLD
jgi:hypothetical protein